MKQKLLILAFALGIVTTLQAQSADGTIATRYSRGVAATDPAAFCVAQLPNLSKGSTFAIVSDKTDKWGARHIALQQYVDGIRVEGKLVIVHMRNGRVMSINGNAMTEAMAAETSGSTLRRAPGQAQDVLVKAGISEKLAQRAELVLVEVNGVCHKAYRVENGTSIRLVDALSGELLKRESKIKHLSAADEDEDDDEDFEVVEGTAETLYSGQQPISCVYDGNQYALGSADIAVYDASYGSFEGIMDLQTMMEICIAQRTTGELTEELDDALSSAMFSLEKMYCNDSPNWTDPYYFCLDSISYILNPEIGFVGERVYVEAVSADGEICCSDTVTVTESDDFTTVHWATGVPYDGDEINVSLKVADVDWEFGYSITASGSACMLNLGDCGTSVVFNNMRGYKPATDVVFGLTNALKYYREVFDYNSFDNNGTQLLCLVNPPDMLLSADNAAAIPLPEGNPGLMYFGMGMDMFKPVVELSILGHEFTHLVARNLDKAPEAAALDESFADFMGLSILRHATGTTRWIFGKGVYKDGRDMRDLEVPELYGDPSCYMDEHYDNVEYEEHTNAGVQNHMFYLLCTGGEGINSLGQEYSVTPLSREKVEALAFCTLVNYTYPGMTYPEAPEAFYQAAEMIWGEGCEELTSVRQAWAAVGLGDGSSSIEQIASDRNQSGRRYNLQGQPVGEDYRGLFIKR